MKRVAIRADASVAIGSGHVMRCLALAACLREQHVDVIFVCRDLQGHLCDLIAVRGFPVQRLPAAEASALDWYVDAQETRAAVQQLWTHADWVIVDHYQLDARWEREVRSIAGRIMAIDDVADRPHDCALLLDQNQAMDMRRRYDGLLPAHCRQLLGPAYALLRDEFRQTRNALKRREGDLQRLLVFFGGSDPGNETSKVLRAIRELDVSGIGADVVVGSANPHAAQVQRLCSEMHKTRFHCQVDNMAALMANADLAIGAGGSTTWERCCLGLPALVVILAENQAALTDAVADYGAIVNLGWAHCLVAEDYKNGIKAISAEQRVRMSALGHALVDGMGASRVAQALI